MRGTEAPPSDCAQRGNEREREKRPASDPTTRQSSGSERG
jgi:hypothetical protein